LGVTSTTSGQTSNLVFSTQNFGVDAYAIARMTIAYNGNVGIGTIAPHGILEVSGVNNNAWVYLNGNAGGFPNPSTGVNYGLMTAWNTSGAFGETQILYGSGLGTGPRLDFGRWNGTTKTIDMTLKNGKLGIGTTNPSYTLDVSGTMRGAVKFGETQVFNGTSPTSYTDLNLSSVIGSGQAMVYLKIRCNSTSTNYAFRTNGETVAVGYPNISWFGGGASAVTINTNYIGYVLVMTDSSGIVEWYGNNGVSTTVYVEAYMR